MKRCKAWCFLCLITVILFLSLTFFTQTFAANLSSLEEGISLYKQENFDEAIISLKKARREEPSSSLVAYYTGITYKQLQDYKEAKVQLVEAISLTPRIKEALLELIEVLYQLGELKEVKEYIEIAEKEGIKPSQVAFLKGLVNLKEERFEEAKKTFKNIIVLDPNSDVAALSDEYMKALEKKDAAQKPLRFTLGLAGQYDTNVLLKPSDASVASNITNESDWREVTTFSGQFRKKLAKQFGIESQYSLYYAHQNKIGSYDVLSHTVSVTPNYYLEKATIGVAAGYNYTDVGERKYLTDISAGPVCNLIIGGNQMAQAYLKYQDKNYARKQDIADEDRNSKDYSGGLGYYFFFSENKGLFGLRYSLDKENAKGANWQYLGNRLTASLIYPFLEKFRLSLAGDAYFQDFSKTNSIFGIKRDDKVYTASSMLGYYLWKEAELQLKHTYVKDHSNITVYDYDRNIYSLGIEYKF